MHVIECKTTDKVTNHDKHQSWLKVTAQFNAKGRSQQVRSMEQLKSKYENLKTKARKCAADNRGHLRGTGGGPLQEPHWDPVLEAILRVINEKTVIGFHNSNDSDAIYDTDDVNNIENIEVINQDEYEEFILLMEDGNKGNTVPIAVGDLDDVPSTSKLDISPVTQVDVINQNADDIQTLPSNWSRYTPKQLKTPKNKKLRPTMPISNSLQLAKEEYYKTKTILLNREIQLKAIEEDRQRKRQRELEEHEIKMKMLQCELILKEKTE